MEVHFLINAGGGRRRRDHVSGSVRKVVHAAGGLLTTPEVDLAADALFECVGVFFAAWEDYCL